MGNKLTTALVIVFAISLLTLFAELFYLFWRRRHADTIRGGGERISRISSPESNLSALASSKGLLYCFCLRTPELRLGSDSGRAEIRNSGEQSEMEVIDIELLKIQGMFGPPRFLFTIDEDEKEELESPAEKSPCAGSQIDVFGGGVDDDDDATPFSTPCSSPVYFTPSVSPVHEVVVNSRSCPGEGLAETTSSEE